MTSGPAPACGPSGRIDLHSHLLPGFDDGCRDLDESLACIRRLLAMGFVGSVCTPHLWPAAFPGFRIPDIAERVSRLRRSVAEAGLPYRLWEGAEVRLFEDADRWMELHGVPTLGGSRSGRRVVLVDTWRSDWPRHQDRTLDWLLAEGFTPLLAHPERTPTRRGFARLLDRLGRRGVLLQGNLRSFSGGEGPRALALARAFLSEQRYACLASDSHRPAGMQDRARGLEVVGERVGAAELARLTSEAPTRLLGLRAGDHQPRVEGSGLPPAGFEPAT